MNRWQESPIWTNNVRENWVHPDSRRPPEPSPDPRVKMKRCFDAATVRRLRRLTGPQRVAWYESHESPDAPVDDWLGKAHLESARIVRH